MKFAALLSIFIVTPAHAVDFAMTCSPKGVPDASVTLLQNDDGLTLHKVNAFNDRPEADIAIRMSKDENLVTADETFSRLDRRTYVFSDVNYCVKRAGTRYGIGYLNIYEETLKKARHHVATLYCVCEKAGSKL